MIREMIENQSFTTSQMAEEAECTELTIINIRRNLRQFGTMPPKPESAESEP
jgi:hypothetical protein